MNSLRTNVRLGLRSNNFVSNKRDATLQVQKVKPQQRRVLGVLHENEQSSTCVEGGRLPDHGSCSDSSTSTLLTYPISSAACDNQTDDRVFDDMEASETHEDYSMQQHNDFRLFLDLSTDETMDSTLPDDSLNSHDAFCVVEYREDIHHYMQQREVQNGTILTCSCCLSCYANHAFINSLWLGLKFRPRVDLLQHHPELTSNMRMVLVDWLVEVSIEYKLCNETLHLAVGYLDRFLSLTKCVKRSELQLVGTAALMIASKYEEIYPPELKEFVYITDDTYTRAKLIKIEIIFLKVLAFQLSTPTIDYFLKEYMTIQSVCSQTENLASYVSDLSLLAVSSRQYVPSVVAAAAYCLANYTINANLWPVSLESFTGYTLAELTPCLKDLHKLYTTAKMLPQKAIRGKYNCSKYDYVSQMSAPAVIPLP